MLPPLLKGIGEEKMDLINYDLPSTASSGCYPSEQLAKARMPSMKERIAMAVQQAEDRLKMVRRASEIFAKYPDIEELLNIMQRGNF